MKNGKKILIGPSTFAQAGKEPLELLEREGFSYILNPYKRTLTKDQLFDYFDQGVTGLIAGLEPLGRDVLEKSNLRVISRSGSGMSNVDLKAAKDLNIEVYCTPDGPVSAVAELTIGALLSLLRNIPQLDQKVRTDQWAKTIGSQLEGKTAAIIGLGRIGQRVAQLLSAFNVKLLGVDPIVKTSADIAIVSLQEALQRADIVTIHASGEEEILGEKELSNIKRGAYICNASRGQAINEPVLVKALDEGIVAGAWLDTFAIEPYQGPLINYPQVVLTPHIGSYTSECRRSMELEAANNLIRAFKKA